MVLIKYCLINEKSVGIQFRDRLLAYVGVISVFLELFLPSKSSRGKAMLSHIYMLPINVLTEWKICHLIYAVPFKEYTET